MKHILLVEDRETTRRMVEETLRRRGHDVRSAGTVAEGRALVAEGEISLLLTDLQLPDGTGLELLEQGLRQDACLPVIVMSAFGTIQIAVEAIKGGAYDFVPKPFDNNHLADLVDKALERRPRAADANGETDIAAGADIVCVGEPMQTLLRNARRVAPSDATVLLLGESGTGKELVARALHAWSGRADGPMVTVNCAAIPAELMEAEFFGSERGSFTGSVARKIGKVELASGGTLFLDEIGEMPGGLQAKLLRVLQERTLTRIGGETEIRVDARIVAATNRDLEEQVRGGEFREDLYYRLNVFPIVVPALRERPGDILPLAQHFVAAEAEKLARPALTLSPEAAAELQRRSWSGNVRELQNVLERAAILADDEIRLEHLGTTKGAQSSTAARQSATLLELGRAAARRAESEAILQALRATDGNKTEAARRLGVSYKTLWSKLKEYELG